MAMQNTITETLDLGIPGEFASTNPRHLDLPYVVNTSVTFGTVVAVKDKECAPVGTATFTAKKGVVVSPHQHVTRGTGGNALAPTLAAEVGDTVAICDMGDVYVELEIAATGSDVANALSEEAAIAAAKANVDAALKTAFETIARNAAVYFANSDGKIQLSSSSATALGRIRDIGDRFYGTTYGTITATESDGKYAVDDPTGTAKVIIALTIA